MEDWEAGLDSQLSSLDPKFRRKGINIYLVLSTICTEIFRNSFYKLKIYKLFLLLSLKEIKYFVLFSEFKDNDVKFLGLDLTIWAMIFNNVWKNQ